MGCRDRRQPAALLAALLVVFIALRAPAAPEADPFAEARERMVREDLAAGGISDPRVLESMRLAPRHEFVAQQQRHLAYFDMALPIGSAMSK